MRVGCQRVSTVDQNTARQLDGIDVDRAFTDHVSGKDTRPVAGACRPCDAGFADGCRP